MKITVQVEGLRDIEAALHELPKTTARNVIRRVLKDELTPVAEMARVRVPVDHGDLRRSITVSTKLSRRQRAQYRKAGPNDIDMFAGPGPHPQAHLQEFGARRFRAQPYLRPAWESRKGGMLGRISQAMWEEIEKAVARRARKIARQGG